MTDYDVYVRSMTMFNRSSSIQIPIMTRDQYNVAVSQMSIIARDEYESQFDPFAFA